MFHHLGTRLQVLPLLQFIKGDIQSGDLLSYILDTEQIDTVMHFAAQVCSTMASVLAANGSSEPNPDWPLYVLQTHVDNSFGNSLAFTMNNTYGTHVLLEACRMSRNIRRVINVSTDEVYGESSLGAEKGVC